MVFLFAFFLQETLGFMQYADTIRYIGWLVGCVLSINVYGTLTPIV